MSGTLAGAAITRAKLQIPAWGAPWADVALSTEVTLAPGDVVDLVIADTTWRMAVVSGGALHGASAWRLVGGAGKWPTVLPPRAYANDAGVKVAVVLGDAAAACGETLGTLPAARLGGHYVRAEGPAAAVLHTLAPRGWYVDEAGVTQIGLRPTTAYTGTAARTRTDTALGVVDLAAEEIAGLVPGVVVDGSAPASDVEIELAPARLTARVWAGLGGSSRRVSAIAGIVRAELAPFRYAGLFEFRVVSQSGERMDLQPVRVASGFGDLSRVPVRPGVAGCRADVTPGELVLVAFVDRDPSRPVVVGHDSAESIAWFGVASSIELGGPGALGVARVTDPIVAGAFAGAITFGSLRVKAAM